ncbi:MAG: tetratricopeptide (TPR) repeat protein, partial [Polyangiales bacterium]
KGLIAEDTPIHPVVLPEDVSVSDGTIYVAQSGCGLDEYLVVAGLRRGELWHDSDMGSVCRPEGFLSFVEGWLDAELARTKLARQAKVEFDDKERVRRVHHHLSDVAYLFDRLHQDRISGGGAEEWLRERDHIFASGVLDWDLRFALGKAADACRDLTDASAVHVALAAFRFELRQDEEALEEIRRVQGGATSDVLLHARILIALGRSEEAEPLLRTLLNGPAHESQGELWYDGELCEAERAFVETDAGVCIAERAAALRFLGEHAAAIALCQAHVESHEWALFELAANHEMMGHREEALTYLRRALAKSHADPASLTRDPAWTRFVESPEFEAMAKSYHA